MSVGGLVQVLAAGYAREYRAQYREHLDVAVVVDGGGAVRLQVERVDHVDVLEVGCRGFIGQVDRVLERQVPYWEGLELGVAGLDAALMLVIELAQACGELARVGAGRGHDHQRPRGLDVGIGAEPARRAYRIHLGGVALDRVEQVRAHAAHLELVLECERGALAGVAGDYHAGHGQAAHAQVVYQPEHVHVVGYAQVGADLVGLYVCGVYADDYLGLVGEVLQEAQLGIGVEARQHARGVVVVEQLAAELNVELVVELAHALEYVFHLFFNV